MIEWDSIWKSFSYRRHSINVIGISCQREEGRTDQSKPVWLGQGEKREEFHQLDVGESARVLRPLKGVSILFSVEWETLKSFKKGDDMNWCFLKVTLAATYRMIWEVATREAGILPVLEYHLNSFWDVPWFYFCFLELICFLIFSSFCSLSIHPSWIHSFFP